MVLWINARASHPKSSFSLFYGHQVKTTYFTYKVTVNLHHRDLKPSSHAAQKISYVERIFICLSNILSAKSFQRTIKNFQRTSKKQNTWRMKFFMLRLNTA